MRRAAKPKKKKKRARRDGSASKERSDAASVRRTESVTPLCLACPAFLSAFQMPSVFLLALLRDWVGERSGGKKCPGGPYLAQGT